MMNLIVLQWGYRRSLRSEENDYHRNAEHVGDFTLLWNRWIRRITLILVLFDTLGVEWNNASFRVSLQCCCHVS